MSKLCGDGKHYIEFTSGDASIEMSGGFRSSAFDAHTTIIQCSKPVACECLLRQAVALVKHLGPRLAAGMDWDHLASPSPASWPVDLAPLDEKKAIIDEVINEANATDKPLNPGSKIPGELLVVCKLYEIAEKFGLTLDMEVSRAQPPAWGTFLSTKAPNEIFFDRLSIIGVTENAAGELFNERVIHMIEHLNTNGFKLVEHEEEDQFDVAGDKQKLTYRRLMATSDLWNPKQREGDVVAAQRTKYAIDPEAFKRIYEIGSRGRFAMKTSEDMKTEFLMPRGSSESFLGKLTYDGTIGTKKITRIEEPDPGLEYIKKLAGGK